MDYTVSKNVSSLYKEHFLEDISSIDWTSNAVNQSINLGPFRIEADLHIDQECILNSYFDLKVDVQIPFVGTVNLIHGRIDKDNPKLEASFAQLAGAAIIFDINELKLYAHLYAFGYSYDIVIWQFAREFLTGSKTVTNCCA
ncbi:hypothetical protein [Clostridium sp.]|jgi:hypothetical protein|uniref:hypothetical protein n=1 Tax=Clostridium sp. TaxID=1506 RepID=UPI0035A1AD66